MSTHWKRLGEEFVKSTDIIRFLGQKKKKKKRVNINMFGSKYGFIWSYEEFKTW